LFVSALRVVAAAQGNASGQTNIGEMYADGRGFPKDYDEAVKWYLLAAGQEYAIAQRDLGMTPQRSE